MARRSTFTDFGLKFYFSLGRLEPPEKFRVLERELERCYCSRAYLACILLADATVGILKTEINGKAREELAKDLDYINDEIQWLRRTRNELTHHPKPHCSASLEGYIGDKSELESAARQACAIVYHVARAYIRLDPSVALQGSRRRMTLQQP